NALLRSDAAAITALRLAAGLLEHRRGHDVAQRSGINGSRWTFAAQDRDCQSAGRVHRVGSHFVHQAATERLLCRQRLAIDDDLQCRRNADNARQTLRAAGTRQNAKLHFGQTQLRVFARDPPMAAQSEFEAAAQRCAVDGGDDRLAGCLHSGNEFAQQRTNLGLRGIELPYVRTAGKEPARTGQHNGLDRVVGQCGGQPFSQRHAYLAADAVNGRIVDTEHGNAGLPDLAQVQVHHGQPSTRTSACPSSTSSPSATRTSTTLPPRSASTGSSIFMDSIFTISSPSLITWPGCTSTLITRPATVDSITCMMC